MTATLPATSTGHTTVLRERNKRLRDLLVTQGRIKVLTPDEEEADEIHRDEVADYDSGEG